ncbi:MAG: hypothetical protein E7545_03025 [Ruminococcaceae bacterium]|nr:hypothetical protein [Oscillospiraceae bacterium]
MNIKELFLKIKVRKTVAVIMAAVILVTTISAVSHLTSFANEVAAPYIMLDGERVEEVVLREDAKLRLYAISPGGEGSFNWQIAHPNNNDIWVNIDGAGTEGLWLTAALVSSMSNDYGESRLRCRVVTGGNESFTAPLKVTLSYNTETDKTESTISGKPRKFKMAARTAAGEHITYSVVINYIFPDNTIAFEPYGATIAKGDDFTDPVESPEIVGYEPFYWVGSEYVSAKFVYPEIYDIQQNVTIDVIYEPAMVDFFIHHHKQDIYDDNYSVTPDEVTNGKAPTGTLVGDGLAFTEEQWPGFKPLAYERLEVAADSSTAIEIRYDRKYYLIDFDMNGGYGAEPVYTRFEATVGTNTPTRHGYIFDGWELVSYGGNTPTAEQKSIYDINGKTISVPAANLTYKARWIVGETKYTMVFWCENADDDGYSYWGHLDNISAMSGDVVNARDLIDQVDGIENEAYFEFNTQKSDKGIVVEGDGSTVVNAYYTRKMYTITFKAAGKCAIEENHQHNDACYEAICGRAHIHDEGCVSTLVCTIPQHTAHTNECIICGKSTHIHGGEGCQCNKTEHTHTASCWNNVGSATSRPSSAPNNPENGYIYYRYSFFYSNYYIYLYGTWYYYNGEDVYSGLVVDPDCSKEEHTHGVDCDCDTEEHTHGDSCYKDVIHTHNEECYTYSCGEDNHVHVDDCYRLICSQPVNHTHSSNCNSARQTNTVKLVKEKYGHSLGEIWPITDANGVVYNSGQRWTPSSSSFYSEVLVYISQMPPDDFTLTLSTSSADTYTMKYYMQVLDGEPYQTSYNGYNYILGHEIVAKYNFVTEDEDFFDIKGFYQYASNPGFSSGKIDTNGGEVKFYYNRITDHKLEFNNNGQVLNDKMVYGIPYGSLLTKYNFTPDYPTNLEPGAYQFSGWYTSPGCFDGTEVDWNTITMSEGDMMLYAKWSPTVHNVRVFLTADKNVQIGETITVPHGNFATEPVGSVTNGSFIFQGWFYMDGGTEKAFVFRGIPITKDMDVYAKWGSHVEVDYKVYYKLKGTDTDVADPTISTSIAGNNKTFEAKAGDQLYEAYRTGYYPNVSSHTVTMSVTGDHTFTFWYDYVESVPYKVMYVDELGNNVADPVIVWENRLSVVTETFVRVEKKMPDAYQKRLVLTSTGVDTDNDGVFDNNVIVFYYSSDEEHAYYRVVHHIQNLDGITYREYRSEEKVGEIGTAYTIKAITLTGFKYVASKTEVVGAQPILTEDTVSATLSAEGLLINLYYDRDTVKYLVQYVDSDYNPLQDDKIGEGVFGAQILEYAPDLTDSGYSLVSENLKMLTLSAVAERNVIIFMYEEITANIKYEIIGPANCGTLVPQAENIKAVSGVAKGTLPTASEGFAFAGWYLDAACTEPVEAALVGANGKFVPEKQGSIWKDSTYYAKFNALKTDLTIKMNSVPISDIDQAFLFTVKGKAGSDTEKINLTVSVTGNGSVTITDLPVGEYTVTYHNAWAWRFKRQDFVTTVELEYNDGSNQLLYSASKTNDKWLDGQHSVNNIF